ncbi:unnamed protein product [Rodentolepis nana]|uniref:Lzipper-MIP1 domain-containing protein n=1 Tax=Rodentolepis nana TaxID=102285 RepID=A0A158QIC8_RODNA|nr:unnamed protein product [Rodentolepis nana]
MLGGEEANNSEVRERRTRRRRHAEERLRILAEANASLDEEADDDGIMISIYESISDELRHKSKLLEREKLKTNSLEIEIGDLQREFEVDRQDYLETIRKQNQHISLLQAILDKVQPCIRKDSNYSNLDKIKKQARYDEETNEWLIPPFITEPTVLPLSINLDSRSVSSDQSHPSTRGFESAKEEEMQLYAKLSSRSQNHKKYLKNNRKEKLLLDAAIVAFADNSEIIVLGKSQYLCSRPTSFGNRLPIGSSPSSLPDSQGYETLVQIRTENCLTSMIQVLLDPEETHIRSIQIPSNHIGQPDKIQLDDVTSHRSQEQTPFIISQIDSIWRIMQQWKMEPYEVLQPLATNSGNFLVADSTSLIWLGNRLHAVAFMLLLFGVYLFVVPLQACYSEINLTQTDNTNSFGLHMAGRAADPIRHASLESKECLKELDLNYKEDVEAFPIEVRSKEPWQLLKNVPKH